MNKISLFLTALLTLFFSESPSFSQSMSDRFNGADAVSRLGDINSFESCLIAGGRILTGTPRQCSWFWLNFAEDLSVGKKGEVRRMLFHVGPEPVACKEEIRNDQSCLVVNLEYFGKIIDGFEHRPGLTSIIEVQRRMVCVPQIDQDCMSSGGPYRYQLSKILSQDGVATEKLPDAEIFSFTGRVTAIEKSGTGSRVTLFDERTSETIPAVMSRGKLVPNSRVEFDHLKIGHMLRVLGMPIRADDYSHIDVKIAEIVK